MLLFMKDTHSASITCTGSLQREFTYQHVDFNLLVRGENPQCFGNDFRFLRYNNISYFLQFAHQYVFLWWFQRELVRVTMYGQSIALFFLLSTTLLFSFRRNGIILDFLAINSENFVFLYDFCENKRSNYAQIANYREKKVDLVGRKIRDKVRLSQVESSLCAMFQKTVFIRKTGMQW